MSRRFHDKIALVTGASRGIGAAIAKQLGAEGAQLIITARTVGGLEEVDDAVRDAGGLPAQLAPLDLASADREFDQLGAHIYERFKRLDLFIACAAMLGPLSPAGHIDPKSWQDVIAVNLTANYRLIRSLDPLLRQSAAAKAVFMTCGQGSMAEAYWGAYAASKAGLERLAACYALETKKTVIDVRTYDPGPCATKLRASAFPGEDQSKLRTSDEAAGKLWVTLV